jgi:hypothetical protein
MLLGGSRRGWWPILAWAPGEDGLNSREGQPPRAPSGWPAGGPACSRPIGLLGVISAPRNSRGLPESRSRESRPAARRPREPHRRNGGWRHPPPSGSPSGPVGPSGRNSNPDFPVQPRRPLGAQRNLEGGRGASRRRFRWPHAYAQLMMVRITSMEFPVMSRASGQAPGCPPVHRHHHRSRCSGGSWSPAPRDLSSQRRRG